MKLKSYIKMLVPALLIFPASCKKFVDTNTDPNNPTTPALELILPATQIAMAAGMNSLNQGTSSVMQYLLNGGQDRYSQTGTTYERSWTMFYTQALNDIEVIIAEGTQRQAWSFVSIAKLEKAYIYSLMVDMWGDIPYNEPAVSPTPENPPFQKGQAIYDKLFLLIDEAIADANKGTFAIQPTGADIIYKGDKTAWIRMANSLKLKLFNQIRLVQRDKAITGINQILTSGAPIITANTQDFSFRFGNTETPANRHPWHRSEYQGSKDFYMSQGLMDRLFNADDPRLRYYITRQNGTAANGNGNTGNGYYGRYSGDPTAAPADLNRRSVPGVYPVGGLYDNNPINNLPATNVYLTNAGTVSNFKAVANTDGTGAGVMPFITNYMVKFIQAEAVLTLGSPGNAQTLLQDGITAHLNLVNTISTTSGNSATPIATTAITTFAAKYASQFAAANDAGKLDILMTQKYIANFGNGLEAYNDYRRTGLPVLAAPVAPLNVFPLRLSYSGTELSTNNTVTKNSGALQTAQQITPVFWDK